MNHKVSRSVFVLALLFVVVGVSVRTANDAPRPAVRTRGQNYRELLSQFKTNAQTREFASPSTARPMSSYRLNESGIVGGMEYTGIGYTARASESGFEFGGKG